MEIDLPVLDEKEEEDAVLLRLHNEIFDTVLLVYHQDMPNEEVYVLDDMQGKFPETFDEVPDYNWSRAEDIDW